jgi:hypothetical protein
MKLVKLINKVESVGQNWNEYSSLYFLVFFCLDDLLLRLLENKFTK